MVPFAKTGGLADVSASLAKMFGQLGHNSIAIIPAYHGVFDNGISVEHTGIQFEIKLGSASEKINILRSKAIPGIITYLVDHHFFRDREGLYGTDSGDYGDNAHRFILFAKASLELIKKLNLSPEVIHCHDWQSGLVPIYLKNGFGGSSAFINTKTVFTIHNLAFQGLFPPETMIAAGLPWSLFHIDGLEFYGKMSFLKGGLVFSDHITTVSPNYAREILTPEYGCGLHGLLDVLKYKLTGIINGIDYTEWDPQSDPFLTANYNSSNFKGKQDAKKTVCKKFDLGYEPEKPLIGMVSRLAAQKGVDLMAEIMPAIFKMPLDLVILGTGDISYHELLASKQKQFPDNFGLRLAFDNELAHLIYAGSDMFLMPSRYEPCGLGQLIALRYGAIPIVRNTGGLADTVIDHNSGRTDPNGFVFNDYSAAALHGAVLRAYNLYQNRSSWDFLTAQAMACDFSWESSAGKYVDLFNQITST